jgi:hypothetical protein
MKKRILQIVAISFLAFGFTSCKKCKDCEYKIDWKITDGYSQEELDALDAQYQATFGMDYEEYYLDFYSSAFTSVNDEYCGDDLEEIEDMTDVNLAGYYRMYWECK